MDHDELFESEIKAEILKSVEDGLSAMRNIWDETGLVGQHRKDRLETVAQVHINLQNDMVKEESEMLTTMKSDLETRKNQVSEMCRRLKLEPLSITVNSSDSLLKQKNLFDSIWDDMSLVKQERLDKYIMCQKTEIIFCKKLGKVTQFKELAPNEYPSEERIERMQHKVITLERELQDLILKHKTMCRVVSELTQKLEVVPSESELDLISTEPESLNAYVFTNIEQLIEKYRAQCDENQSLIRDLMPVLEMHWDCFEVSCEERAEFSIKYDTFGFRTIEAIKAQIGQYKAKKLENIELFIGNIRREIQNYWGKCFVADEHMEKFTPLLEENLSVELLEVHEAEATHWKKYYENHSEIFEKFAERQKLWMKTLELEHKANDPSRYNNRGGNLLREEKERKMLRKTLPKLEKQISDLTIGKSVSVYGVEIIEYCSNQWDERDARKNNKVSKKSDGSTGAYLGTPSCSQSVVSSAGTGSEVGSIFGSPTKKISSPHS